MKFRGIPIALGLVLALPGVAGAGTTRTATEKTRSQAENDASASSEILFAAYDDDDLEIYKMSLDGTEIARLTRNHKLDDHPTWSPDRKRIAYIRNVRGPKSQLWLMRPDGTRQRRLIGLGGEAPHPSSLNLDRFDLSWSPDGKRIVFSTPKGISVVKVDGTGRTKLVGDGFSPEWSPDGQKIAFTRGAPSTTIWIMKPDGSGQQQLTQPPPGTDTGTRPDGRYPADMTPTWAPDDSRIAFVRASIYVQGFWSAWGGYTDVDDAAIFAMGPDGSELHQVSDESDGAMNAVLLRTKPSGQFQPSFSPSGDRIVYTARWADLYSMSSDGSGRTTLMTGRSFYSPDWS